MPPFDIAAFDTLTRSETGAAMTVLMPKPPFNPWIDADGKPITVTLKGRNSAAFRNLQAVASRRAADRESRGVAQTDEEAERERIDTLVALTLGWSFDTLDGAPFPFSSENAVKLWSDVRWPWLRTQAMNFVLSEGNFLAT